MIAEALDTGTWRWARSCATWVFEIARPPDAPAAAAIAACARGVLAALPGFAVPAVADWTTESAGDEAAVQARGTTIDDATVTEATIDDGAVVHIELEDVDVPGRTRLVLWFSLNVDLYARRTFGTTPDNEQLARLNAARLTGFLARLVEATGARFHSVDAPSYGGQATPRGFA